MTKNLTEETVTHSLKVTQSAIGGKIDKLPFVDLINIQNTELIYLHYSKEKSSFKIKQTIYSERESILELEDIPFNIRFIMGNVEIWFSFPRHFGCLWSTIYLDSLQSLRMYTAYLNNHYQKSGNMCWHNIESDTLICIFFIKKEKRHAIVVMKNDEKVDMIRNLFKSSI